ncbi:MAG: TIGR02466 family protein [Schlesneria sp.]
METIIKEITPLFFSPLIVVEVPNSADLNRKLLDETASMRRLSPGLQLSNQNGWHSALDFFERAEPGCVDLARRIIDAIRQATQAISPGFDFSTVGLQCEGWINVNGKGGFNTPHDHPGWAWSGTYYVQLPENPPQRSGCIEFLDSRTNVRCITVDGASCFMSKYTHRPVSGTMLLFPSYLRHWVYPNEQDEERVSIAFNARFARLPKK